MFNDVNRINLVNALNNILGDDNEETTAMEESEFRILSVGGFSNLACVDNVIAKKLKTNISNLGRDPRIIDLPTNEKYYAIAYGAALFASKLVVQSTKSPIKISIKSYGKNGEKEHVLLPEGIEQNSDEPIWCNTIFEVMSLNDVRVKLSISSSDINKPYEFECDISKTIANKGRIRLGIRPSTYELCVQVVNGQEGFNTLDLSPNVISYISTTEGGK